MKKLKIQKKLIVINFILVYLFIAVNSVNAQVINRFYVDMPEVLNPVLSQKQRYELLEYTKSGLGDSIPNRFNKESHIVRLDTIYHYIHVKNAASTDFEMFLFENNRDTVIGVIKTICSPICQSVINFYNTSWRKYPLSFNYPKAEEWLTPQPDVASNENYRNILNVSFIALTYNPVTKQITAKNNSLEYLDSIDKERIEDKMNNEDFVYVFQNNQWIKQ